MRASVVRRPARPGRWRLPHRTITPDGASHDILASAPDPVPVVYPDRLSPRPPIRTPARPPLPRGGPGPRAADRHQLDQGRRAERPIPVLLPRRGGGRPEG